MKKIERSFPFVFGAPWERTCAPISFRGLNYALLGLKTKLRTSSLCPTSSIDYIISDPSFLIMLKTTAANVRKSTNSQLRRLRLQEVQQPIRVIFKVDLSKLSLIERRQRVFKSEFSSDRILVRAASKPTSFSATSKTSLR